MLSKGLSEFCMLEDSLFKQKEYAPLETVTILMKIRVVSRMSKKMLRFRGLCYLDDIKHPNNFFSIKFRGYSSRNSVFMSLGMVLHPGSVTGPESLAKLFASLLAQKLFEAPYCQFSHEVCLPQNDLT